MYAKASDDKAGTLLGVFSGAETGDKHFEASLLEMVRVDRVAAASGVPFMYVVVVDKDVPRPPPLWRKRFSDANSSVASERFYFLMVTTSMLIRGVYTAVTWLTPKRPGHYYAVLGSVSEAQRWLQAQGISAPDLAALEQHARSALQSTGRASVRPA